MSSDTVAARVLFAREGLIRAVALVLQAEYGLPVGEPDDEAEAAFELAAQEALDLAAREYVSALNERAGR